MREIQEAINRPMGRSWWLMSILTILLALVVAGIIQTAPYGWDPACLFARCVKVKP